MPSTIVDSAIFGNIFSTDAMRAVWSDENRTQKYLYIEAALARVQARLGIIPQEAADEIVKNCTIDKIDMGKLRQQTERIGYPVLGTRYRSGSGPSGVPRTGVQSERPPPLYRLSEQRRSPVGHPGDCPGTATPPLTSGAVSGRMSMRQPVSLAARRAFCPSLPMASESW